ncbi:MAG: tRNA uridine-5-carboxymethylaminomethyl(34) synthesis GTPase MnmE [Bacillota bacterium]|jgi:tRNA modification GTPase
MHDMVDSYLDADTETIGAIASPMGTGGIAIVRLSGGNSVSIADKMIRLRRRGGTLHSMASWSMALADIVDTDAGTTIDEAVVLLMKGPRSYTGEDVVEIQCHGGMLVAEKVLNIAFRLGVRAAMPGEFTRRAFLNGRITLDEAEAVLDVINSASEASLSQAGRRLKGELGAMVERWESLIIDILALLQGSMDFPENIESEHSRIEALLTELSRDIGAVLAKAPLGLALSGGVEVCLVGRPNVGKSSLFNALLSRERAIVTDIPGTTRDVLSERTQWYGLPVVLLDTAGLRQTREVVEAMGVERAKSAAQESNVILYVLDDTEGILEEDREWLTRWQDRYCVAVVTKGDLGKGKIGAGELDHVSRGDWVRVSSVTGEGLEELKKRVQYMFTSLGDPEVLAPGSARQVDCLERALNGIRRALDDLSLGWTDDVVVLSLEEAARALMELTGKVVSNETLDRIFSRFCVGK